MNTLENNWRHLSGIFRDWYTKNGVEHRIDRDLQYLTEAYFEVEAFWNQAFEEIEEVKLVLFGEAPLYGSKKSYFYNPATPPTQFFHYNDARVIVDTLPESNAQNKTEKIQMLQELNKAGLLIVDLFPFSLNPGCTELDYKTISKTNYAELFTSTIEHHLACKLRAILPKTTQSTQFAFRYKKLEKLESQTLCNVNKIMDRSLDSIESIGGQNMDRSKLRALWSISTAT